LPTPRTTHDSHQSLFSLSRQRPPSKTKESPAGSWRSCFSLRKPSSVAKRRLQRSPREPSETEVVALAGESSPCLPRRAGASSDGALCASIDGGLLGSTSHGGCDGEKELIQVHALISPGCAEDADLSLLDTTVTSLDCDPVPLQCSPAQAQSECPDSSTSTQEQVSVAEEKPSLLEGDLESGLQPQAPGSSTESSEPLSSVTREDESHLYPGPLTPSCLLHNNKSTLVLNQRLDCLPSLHSQRLGRMQRRARHASLQRDGCGVRAAELWVCSRYVWLWDVCSE
ncbi:rho GTPase-activating protein 32-like, partial [Phasianus colchicus]|uniref:rho GTPase-activating protein 32-like n=1 Tax=Phasianus colchicus TaxID=9054 RepID=UPI00129E8B22